MNVFSCEIRVGSSKTIVGCMYRPPNYDQNHDLNFLFFDQFRKLASAQVDQILICGDFDYGEIDWKLHSGVPVCFSPYQKFPPGELCPRLDFPREEFCPRIIFPPAGQNPPTSIPVISVFQATSSSKKYSVKIIVKNALL